ncbi:hypothetical protein [Spirochaeta africana]|uniref:Uncharacterized protein n=1 Tax=Spirochaeta africana (strain ATCC 700263 / DSM 8902 / Z-7692) TaxID=889378 RepID=H9UK50_SPIAZ|nr:hypothetical protein [Spirochaeta africana]AFG37893.1 hypothetical protein Spiaf_1836 [Spirochaeta africana DSM 8902]
MTRRLCISGSSGYTVPVALAAAAAMLLLGAIAGGVAGAAAARLTSHTQRAAAGRALRQAEILLLQSCAAVRLPFWSAAILDCRTEAGRQYCSLRRCSQSAPVLSLELDQGTLTIRTEDRSRYTKGLAAPILQPAYDHEKRPFGFILSAKVQNTRITVAAPFGGAGSPPMNNDIPVQSMRSREPILERHQERSLHYGKIYDLHP